MSAIADVFSTPAEETEPAPAPEATLFQENGAEIGRLIDRISSTGYCAALRDYLVARKKQASPTLADISARMNIIKTGGIIAALVLAFLLSYCYPDAIPSIAAQLSHVRITPFIATRLHSIPH